MARTKASEKRKAARVAQWKVKHQADPLFKAATVDHILSNYHIEQNAALRKRNLNLDTTNSILMTTIGQQSEDIVAHQHRIRTQALVIEQQNGQRITLETDNLYMDEIMREIFTNHPDICWEYRNRISYHDIEPVDPDLTEEEHYRHLFSDTDDEDLEVVLERRMENEGYM